MAYPIDKKFVITVTTSALFDMKESDEVFRTQGIKEYKKYQESHIDDTLAKGVAFPFIRRILTLNEAFPDECPVEVVLFSKNSPDAGLRALRSIAKYGLNITRSLFTSGFPNFQYLPAYNSTLFLTSNPVDTKAAIDAGYAAGTVLNKDIIDDEDDRELRLGFDFDSVVADDSSETFYKTHNDILEYFQHEKALSSSPLAEGPLGDLLRKIAFFQKKELKKRASDPTYQPILKTSIITARNAPAHERVVTTLKEWDIDVDQVFFLGGIEKGRILDILKPHLFFDDQMLHLEHLVDIPAVHIPFGIANKSIDE
jgi:5'-nucleotidase